VPTFAPAAPVPTFDPNSPLTAIVLTANAAATQTQLFAPPTFTPTFVTRTPLPTETASPTFVFFLPTIVFTPTKIQPGSSGLNLECQVLSVDPANGSVILPSTAFVARWTIINVGKYAWPSDNTDYRYVSGNKIYTQPIYDFENSVPSGSTTVLTVNMKAPETAGSYSTSWRITIGKEQFCPMNLTITVG
jgi:hypothetical protein